MASLGPSHSELCVDYSQQTAASFGDTLPNMLGKELRKARMRAGLTQEELAFAAHVDRTYISMLENDKKSPTVDMLMRICKPLGISASQFLAQVEKATKVSK